MKTQAEIDQLNRQFQGKGPEEFLGWVLKEFHPRVAFASSFGLEDVVVIDMLAKTNPSTRIFTLDTGRLNEETYDVMDRIRRHYKISVESYFPDAKKVEELERAKGFYSFRESIENRKECCQIRKVEPLKRALSGLDGWITGLRREQSVTRSDMQCIENDSAFKILKFNPLIDWTLAQVWDYVKKNNVPYNRLHDQGYPSIGCAPCTRAIKKGEDVRAGRWWWENPDHKECGLHLPKRDGQK